MIHTLLFQNQPRRSQTGQSLTELALMLPVLMLILVGTLDLGRLLDAYVVMSNAAREGVRYAIDYPTSTDAIKNRALQEATSGGSRYNDLTSSMITVSGQTSDGVGGNYITVSINYPFSLITTYLFAGLDTIPVHTSASMQVR